MNTDAATHELELSLSSAGDIDLGPWTPQGSRANSPSRFDHLLERAMSLSPPPASPEGSPRLCPNLSVMCTEAPGADGDGSFRLTGKKFMLTYKSHLNKQDLFNFVLSKFKHRAEVKICHETGETGYLHTHCLVSLDVKPDIKNARAFDHKNVHPNITLPKSVDHWQNMVRYVSKEDDDCLGEITIKQSQQEKFSAAADYVRKCSSQRQIYACPDVELAMVIAGRLPYFTALWNHCGKRTPNKALHSTGFTREKLDTSYNWLLYGDAGTGKTNFALSHFENPVLVSHIDDLKKINDETDGIVFDDMAFNKYPHGSIIHLLDRDMERSIHSRYFNATIPANIPKIFTSNRDDIFIPEGDLNEEQMKALKRRYKVLHVTVPLFQ
jgi:hypothetical protein